MVPFVVGFMLGMVTITIPVGLMLTAAGRKFR